MPGRSTSRVRAIARWTLRILAFGALFVVGAYAGVVWAAFPTLDKLERRAAERHVAGAITARDGNTVLRRLEAPQTRTYLADGEVPDRVVDAVVAAEDRRFFHHAGIDLRGIARAARADLQAKSAVEGGSTITQQLVKNTYVGPDRTLARKSREAVLALALETRWSKRHILTTYLNTAYFGDGHYGLADAARGYFARRPEQLDSAQAALLAALLRSPEGTNPVTTPRRALMARNAVIDAMQHTGTITAREAQDARATPVRVRRARRRSQAGELAPQFTDSVVGDLIARYGVNRALGGGLRVRTTIDADLQRAANEAVSQVEAVGLDAALVAIDPATGEVRAMAHGGAAASTAFNAALQGQRQPGSAFKPFMLTAAYRAGLAPTTPLLSAPFDKEYPAGRFRVTNGGGYAGTTTLERATWQSDNTVYARLQDRLGIDAAITAARAAGIRSRMDPVPALVLGAMPYGATPAEMAQAYATFAARGVRTTLRDGSARTIMRVDEGAGRMWRPIGVRRQAIERTIADQVTDTLRGVIDRGTGTSAAIGRAAAGKTGTTEDYRDAWFVGYTPDLAVAVWVGHLEGGVPMRTQNGGAPVTGGSIPARIWRAFMKDALAEVPEHDFELDRPEYITVRVDEESGLLAGIWCLGAVDARFIKGKEPTTEATNCPSRTRPAPDLRGMSLGDARTILADEQFTEPRDETRLVARAEQHEHIIEQDPAPGEPVTRDQQIVVTIGDHPFSR